MGPAVQAVVKWFNPDKGFGFIELSDGSGDAFLHASVLAQNGINIIEPGETLEVRLGPGHKGPHVTEVLSVDSSTAMPQAGRAKPLQQRSSSLSSENPIEEAGTVKWFNPEKGFGFITLEGDGRDVFVHVSALERSGLTALNQGERVIFDIAEGRKGPEVGKIRLV